MLLVSLSLPSLPLASPRTHRDYVVVSATECTWASARTRKKRRQRTVKRRAGPHFGGFWRTRARDSFDPAGTLRCFETKRGSAAGSRKKRGLPCVISTYFTDPSGCALRCRDAHHTTISIATATILTARLPTHLEGKPAGELAERARRENRTPGGDGLVASGRYITCVLPAAVLNACDLSPLHLAPGTTREGRSSLSRRNFRGYHRGDVPLDAGAIYLS